MARIRLLPVILAAAMACGPVAAQPRGPQGDTLESIRQLPDWSGVWENMRPPGGRPEQQPKPRLTAEGEKRYAALQAAKARGERIQSHTAACIPPSPPRSMAQPYPFEILFTPGRVTILMEIYTQARRIYTDGRPLPEDPDPRFQGNSIGHWEGDTLVIDTIGFVPTAELQYDFYHSGQMRLKERIRLIDKDTLEVRTTITDPVLLAAPIEQVNTHRRRRDWTITEYVCAENNRDSLDELGRPQINLEREPAK